MRPVIIADRNIPFLEGRLDNVADVAFVGQSEFTPDPVRDADALLVRTRTQCGPALLEGSRVSLVATGTIGTDHIDIPWCESRGIEVVSAPGCNAPGVAQYVWSALHNLGFNPGGGERLGVVGCGHIGSIVAAWGRAMGAEVWIADPPRQRLGIEDDYHPLEEIMSECHAVTFHTPLTRGGIDPTWHMAGEKELAMMRPGAILINAARGPVVDNAALKKILSAGTPLHVVLDTWEGEPDIDRELLKLVDFGTFHIAGYSLQGKQRATRMLLEAVERHFGVTADKSGLSGPYSPSDGQKPVAADIALSYDIKADTEALRARPEMFDNLRNSYHYRSEYGL